MYWMCCDLMFSAVDSELCSPGWSPGWVLLGKTLYTSPSCQIVQSADNAIQWISVNKTKHTIC